jgi:hypothetical protein
VWREFVVGHWLLILRPLIEVLADRTAQLDLSASDSLELLLAVLGPCAQPALLRLLAAVSDAVLALALDGGAGGGGSGGMGVGGSHAISPSELKLAAGFARHFEGIAWPAAAKAAHHHSLQAAADGLLERVGRKLHELKTLQRARGVVRARRGAAIGRRCSPGASSAHPFLPFLLPARRPLRARPPPLRPDCHCTPSPCAPPHAVHRRRRRAALCSTWWAPSTPGAAAAAAEAAWPRAAA